MDKIPKRYTRTKELYPEVLKAYEALGDAVHSAGPLDDKTRALIKVAISTGARMEGAVHSHTRKAIKAGATKEELHHVAMLSTPTIGFPNMMAALSWIDDVFDRNGKKK
jgi:4-carboxymuconolactone decarboxylase